MANTKPITVEIDFIGKDKGVQSAIDSYKKALSQLKDQKGVDPIDIKGLEAKIKRYENLFDELQKQSKDGLIDKQGIETSEQILHSMNSVLADLSKGFKKVSKDASASGIGSKEWKEQIKNLEAVNKKLREQTVIKQELSATKTASKKTLNKTNGAFNDSTTFARKNTAGKITSDWKDFGTTTKADTNQTSKTVFIEETMKRVGNVSEETASKIRNILGKAVDEVLNKNQNATVKDVIDNIETKATKATEGLKITESEIKKINNELNKMAGEKVDVSNIEELSKATSKTAQVSTEATKAHESLSNTLTQYGDAVEEARVKEERLADQSQDLEHVQNRLLSFFSIGGAVAIFRRAMGDAIQCITDLDAAMTETAVVTDYTVSDMWNKLDEYTKIANDLGATTQGAYETMTLYFQQGLNQQQAFEVGTETMKMARIAGMDYAETTDAMTAALRGFNMEINQTSAQHINDVYSELAAITASDTAEISTAMSKTASIADSAGLDFDTASMYLAKAIETTREAPRL